MQDQRGRTRAVGPERQEQDKRDRTRDSGPERQDQSGRIREAGPERQEEGNGSRRKDYVVRQLGRSEEGQGTGETTWDRRIDIIRYV